MDDLRLLRGKGSKRMYRLNKRKIRTRNDCCWHSRPVIAILGCFGLPYPSDQISQPPLFTTLPQFLTHVLTRTCVHAKISAFPRHPRHVPIIYYTSICTIATKVESIYRATKGINTRISQLSARDVSKPTCPLLAKKGKAFSICARKGSQL